MEKGRKLPAFGLFSLLTVCGVFCAALYSRFSASVPDLLSFAAAQAAAAAAGVLAVFFAPRCDADSAEKDRSFSPEGVPLAVCLMLLAAARLSEFALFLGTFTHMSLRFAGFVAALLAVSLSAARRGISAVGRCACVLFAASAVVGVTGCVLLSCHSSYGLSGQTITAAPLLRSAALTASQLTPLAAVFAFPEAYSEKSSRVSLALGCIAAPAFAALLSLLSLSAIGRASLLTDFPFYTAAQAVGVGAVKRLDVLFLCARNWGAFLLMSLLFCSSRELFKRRSGERIADVLTAAGAALAGGCAYLSLRFDACRRVILSPWLTLSAVALALFVIPLIRRISTGRPARLAALLLAVSLAAFTLGGCEKVQLQDRMIVKGVGIDKSSGQYLVTVQYLDNYSDGDKQENKAVSVIGGSVSEALGRLKDSTGSEPFFGQTSAFIIGSETARDDLYPALTYFLKYSEVRPTARFYLSETTALELLTAKNDGKLVPIDHMTAISPSGSDDDRFTLLRFINSLQSPTDTPCAAVLGMCEGDIRLSTVAYLPPGRVNMLSDEDYLAYCLLTGLDSEAVVRAGNCSCEVVRCKAKGTVTPGGERAHVELQCDIRLSTLENDGLTNGELSALFSRELTDRLEASARSVINGSGCDIYEAGRSLTAKETRAAVNGGYEDLLRGADVTVTAKCEVTQAKALR